MKTKVHKYMRTIRAIRHDRKLEVEAREDYIKDSKLAGLSPAQSKRLKHIAREEDHHKRELDVMLKQLRNKRK